MPRVVSHNPDRFYEVEVEAAAAVRVGPQYIKGIAPRLLVNVVILSRSTVSHVPPTQRSVLLSATSRAHAVYEETVASRDFCEMGTKVKLIPAAGHTRTCHEAQKMTPPAVLRRQGIG